MTDGRLANLREHVGGRDDETNAPSDAAGDRRQVATRGSAACIGLGVGVAVAVVIAGFRNPVDRLGLLPVDRRDRPDSTGAHVAK